MTALREKVDAAVEAEQAEATARAAALDNLRSLRTPAPDEDGDEDDAPEDDAVEGEVVDENGDPIGDPDEAEDKAPALVAAGRRGRTDFSRLPAEQAKRKPAPTFDRLGHDIGALPEGMTITLSTNMVRGGTALERQSATTTDIGRLFTETHPGNGRTGRRGAETSDVLARIETKHEFTINSQMSRQEIEAVVSAATHPYLGARDPKLGIIGRNQQGLVAAPGWCAPPERMWTLAPVTLRGSYIDLPTIGSIGRGGIEVPIDPDIAEALDDMYADPTALGFYFTEAEEIARAEAGTPKPCVTLPCIEWGQVQWDIDGFCITGDVLQDQAWPELVRNEVDRLLALHKKKRGMWTLAQVLKGSDVVPAFSPGFGLGAFDMLLSAVELAASDIRERIGVADATDSFPIEVILPQGARKFIRQDLRRRRDYGDNRISDAQIAAHFADLNVRIQYVSDWQVRDTGLLGLDTPALAWPSQLSFLAYPAGTWFAMQDNIVNMGRTTSPELARQNKFVQLFTEDARAVFKRGRISRLYTVPLGYGGRVGQEAAVAIGGTPVAATGPTGGGVAAWSEEDFIGAPVSIPDQASPVTP